MAFPFSCQNDVARMRMDLSRLPERINAMEKIQAILEDELALETALSIAEIEDTSASQNVRFKGNNNGHCGH